MRQSSTPKSWVALIILRTIKGHMGSEVDDIGSEASTSLLRTSFVIRVRQDKEISLRFTQESEMVFDLAGTELSLRSL